MFNREIPNISNLSWMKMINKYLISLIPVGDMGEKAFKMMLRGAQKNRMSILSCGRFLSTENSERD
jgi:hypothetical protein